MIRQAMGLVEGLARDVGDRWGVPEAIERASVSSSWRSGTVRLCIETPDAGTSDTTISVDEQLIEDLLTDGPVSQDLRLRFSDLVRLEARARALQGYDLRLPPAWSVTVPRLFHALLSNHGMGVQDAIDRIDDYSGWEGVSPPLGQDCELSSFRICNGRLLGTITLRREGVVVEVRSGDDQDGDCSVTLSGAPVPETVIPALNGLPLERVVADDQLSACDGSIVREARLEARNGSMDLSLYLEADHVWGGAPPEGLDMSWRDIREGRRLPPPCRRA